MIFTEADDLKIRDLLTRTETEMLGTMPFPPPPPMVNEEDEGGGWLLFGVVMVCFFGFMASGFIAGLWLARH